MWHPTKEAVRHLWGRRWVRRVSYLAVAGGTVLTLGPWLATRPAVLHWAMGKVDALVREETGLGLSVGKVQWHPALGYLELEDVRLGEDLLTVKRIEVQAELWSLLGSTHRVQSVRIERPQLRLTEAGLASIHLKSHPPRKGPLPQVWLDFFSLTGGEVLVPEPVRGIPALRYQFEVKGTGPAPNRLRLDLTGARLAVKGPAGWETGRLDLNGEVSELAVKLQEGYLRVGDSQVRLSGHFDTATPAAKARLEARFTGVVDLAQATRWGGVPHPPLTGDADLSGSIQGPLDRPLWTLAVEGQDLRPPANGPFRPGSLELKASGGLDLARLERLRWASAQGDLEVRGSWSRHGAPQASLQGTNLDLDALGRALRVPELQGVRGTLQADMHGPIGLAHASRADRWKATVQVGLAQHGREAGGFAATLDQGRLTLDRLQVDLESLKAHGSGWATLGPRRLLQMEGEGEVEVDAGQVAQALRAWKVVDLDMEGGTRAQAKVHWTPAAGFGLDGTGVVTHPRWHGARADSVQAQVEIRGSDLWVKDIDLRKDAGSGRGDLWLTWGRTLPGQAQIDMCYTASRLPVSEGLKAADLGDLPLQGLGGGWVRIHGPFTLLNMEGHAQVESGEVYGIKIPAASSDFDMDLDKLRLRLAGVRIAERPDLLGRGEAPPEGALALTGRADMDFQRWTWWVELGGRLDTQLLALPGPRIQSQVEARLLGPITSPYGPLDLPEGRINLSRGRIFFGDRSVEGLEGEAGLERGRLQARLGLTGMTRPLLQLHVAQEGPDLVGRLALDLSPDTAQSGILARSLTDDLLEDLSLTAQAQGRWQSGRLAWSGSLDRLEARFNAFELHQSGPSALRGDARGAVVDIPLEGGARPVAGQAAGIRLSGTVPFSLAAPMAIRAQGSANLAHLKAIMDKVMEVDEYSLLSELRVQGTGRFDILAHGTYAEPLLDGRLSLQQGEMHLRGYQGVEDLQAEVVLKDRTLSLAPENPLRGTLAHGDLVLSGAVAWQPGGLDTYRLKASLGNFQLRDLPDGIDLQGSLQATLEGGEDGGVLRGRLRADRLSYQTEVKLADLILRSALSDTGGLTGLDLDDPLERIRLDLDLDLRAPWSFDTNLLKLEGRTEGPFQVVGTLAHPVPKGTMVFQPGGRITNIFPAGDMVVDRGSLAFSEARPMDPFITLQGSVSSIPGYTVNLDIRGTLSNLAIVPSSTPSLRQDEIVAILINPGNVGSVGTAGASSGATQGAITSGLASASSGLISTLAFAPFQEQLRRTLGLDRVNVAVRTTSLGSTETEVTLGKSINLLGQRSAFVVSHKKSGELSITSGQVEWRFGGVILQLGASKGGSSGLTPSGEIRHSWSPK